MDNLNDRVGVYLLHFDTGVGNAKHYVGWSINIGRRVKLHQKGQSRVALTREAARRGIKMSVVRIWEGCDRDVERRLKNRKKSRLMCPICNPNGWQRNGCIEEEPMEF